MEVDQATIFLIDDDASVRKSLVRLLKASGYQSESFASAEEYLAREQYNGVGVIILDINMPGLDGLNLQSYLLASDSYIPIIFLTGHGDIPTSVTAMKRGAVNFLTKPVDEPELLNAIQEALWRHMQVQNQLHNQKIVQDRFATLTPREYEIMRYVISGARNKQIAQQLGIAEKTIKVHRSRVLEKIAVNSVAELVRLCSSADISPLVIAKTTSILVKH